MKKLLIAFLALLLTGCAVTYVSEDTSRHTGIITEEVCNAMKTCPEDFECWLFEDMDRPHCVSPKPCNWHCDEKCIIRESNPPQLTCE